MGSQEKDKKDKENIEKLSDVARFNINKEEEQDLETGEAALTPVQNWFFEQKIENMNHWNESILLEVRHHMSYPVIRRIFERLIVHHDILRSKFINRNNTWFQSYNSIPEEVPLEYIDVSQLAAEEKKAAIEQEASEIQKGLNITDGPVIKAAYFNMGDEYKDRLMIAIHHLAVDSISWKILIEDLMTLYKQIKINEELKLQPKTTSYKKWSEVLNEYAQTDQIKSEAAFWLNRPYEKISLLPKDIEPSGQKGKDYAFINERLNQKDTEYILESLRSGNRFQAIEVFMAALVLSLRKWTENNFVFIDLECNCRTEIRGITDTSRTVGWFISVYPLLIESEKSDSAMSVLLAVGEQLRSITNQGAGFGLLKYNVNDSIIREKFLAIPQPEINFSYTGEKTESLNKEELFILETKESKGNDKALNNSRMHLIDVNGKGSDIINFEFSYNTKAFRRETIQYLADSFAQETEQIIAELKKSDNAEYKQEIAENSNKSAIKKRRKLWLGMKKKIQLFTK